MEGELTWTKARLLCRVASVDDEGLWVAFDREKTARSLSREVRAVDVGALESSAAATDEDGVPEEQCETVQLRCTPAVPWEFAAPARTANGGAVEKACGEAEGGPGVAAAEAANACVDRGRCGELEREPEPGQRRRLASSPERHSSDASSAPPAAQTELPPSLSSLVAGLENADAFELDERLRRAVALEQRLEAEMGPLLLRIAEGRLHRAAGFTSMDEYARERLGISPRKARALLRLERAGRRARLLRYDAGDRLSPVPRPRSSPGPRPS